LKEVSGRGLTGSLKPMTQVAKEAKMWDLWLVKLSNVITLGNLGAVATLIGGGIYFFYKIRRYLALQHYQYLEYLKELEMQHKKEIEQIVSEQGTKE
jgi:hypothetical protein